MRLVSFFGKVVSKWNESKKCGYCFSFHAPLTEEALNKQQLDIDSECCINVLLTRDRTSAFGTDIEIDRLNGVNSSEWKYKNFVLYFLIPQGMDLNNHTEILGNDTHNAKYIVLEDLEECIDEIEIDFCEHLDRSWLLSNWNAMQVINYRDLNYTGYRVSFSIRQRKVKNKSKGK